MRRVVIDTNILVAAVRSRRGAAFQLMSRVGGEEFDIALSVPLVLEYEDALVRHLSRSPLTQADVAELLDYLCSIAVSQQVFFLWRPFLRDPRDDMVLEVAVAAGCDRIITYNRRDFAGVERFGIRVATPAQFLSTLGAIQ